MSKRLEAAGRFKARIISHAVTLSGKQSLPQWAAKFGAFEQEGVLQDANGQQIRDGNGRPKLGWLPLDDEYEIVAYLPLAYVDKDTNEREFTNTFNNLQEALGWTPNPSNLFGSLQDMDLSAVNVQIVVNEEEYQGKPQYRVAFVNPVDFEGVGVRPLDSEALAKINNEWAATFRAKFGGSAGAKPTGPIGASPAPKPASPAPAAAAAPARPAGAPTAPAPAAGTAPASTPTPTAAPSAAQAPATTNAPSPAAQAAPPKPPVSKPVNPPSEGPVPAPGPGQKYAGPAGTMEDAWSSFAGKKGNMSDEKLSDEWFRLLAENFSARTDDEIAAVSPDQWGWMRDHGDPIPF